MGEPDESDEIEDDDNSLAPVQSEPIQFSLRSLLILFLLVALGLSLARFAPLVAIWFTAGCLVISVGMPRQFWARFALAFLVMVGVNFLPTYFSYRAFELDGAECTGWPFTFYVRGSVTLSNPERLMIDLLIAVAVSYLAAESLKHGWGASIRYLRTWGLKNDG